MDLDVGADLGSGYSCGAFNPLKFITNTFKNFASSAENISQTIIANMQGSIAEVPMYMIAQADPSLYNLINNTLLGAHNQLAVSTKACEQVKQEISQGKNPYQDWATLSVNNQWKKHLSLTASGDEDINDAKKDIDSHSGDDGVPWVQGKKTDAGTYAGGKDQPPVQVVSDTVKAGFNALLNRDLTSSDPAPAGTELAVNFTNPQAAQQWITNVVGDQTITTCTGDASCQNQQSAVAGRGLLPWISSCSLQNQDYCTDTIRTRLTDLVTGVAPLTTDNLNRVSADGVIISPQVIQTIHRMDSTQQSIVINKLAEQVASQKVLSRALMARHILQAGSQVPIIADNQPAQKILDHAMTTLDKEMQSLAFEAELRKDMISDTVSQVLAYAQGQQQTLEWYSSVFALSLLALSLCYPILFYLPEGWFMPMSVVLIVFSGWRGYQGFAIWRYQRHLRQMPHYALSLENVPRKPEQLFLGKGFLWTPILTQWLRDLDLAFNSHYIRHQKTAVGGHSQLHGISLNEAPIFMDLADRGQHVLVLGTTGVGKTRFAELLIAQDIARGDVVIILDPKGDVELMRRVLIEAKRAGREQGVHILHLGFPALSCRYNPIGFFTKLTQVATRIANALPSSGEAAAFKEFAWKYVNIVARGLMALAIKSNYRLISFYLTKLDQLFVKVCKALFAQDGTLAQAFQSFSGTAKKA